jgi:hypothetical protein
MAITLPVRWLLPLCLGLATTAASQELRAPEDWTGQTDSATQEVLVGAKLIDSVVAIVGRRVITLSQLRTEARVALAAHGATATAQGPLSNQVLGSTLDYVINEDLVEEEASRLQVFPVTNAEGQVAEEQLAAGFPSREAFESFLAHFDIDHERLRAILRRGLRASRYLENRLRLQSQASDAEVDALLARSISDATVPQTRPLARAYLQRQKYQVLAAALVRELRSRADVRILADFGAAIAGGAGTTVAPPTAQALPADGTGSTGHLNSARAAPPGEQ